jgi:twinkle protein
VSAPITSEFQRQEALATSSEFQRHEACEECGSSDAKGVFSDGHAYCFSCEHYFHAPDEEGAPPKQQMEVMTGPFLSASPQDLPKRRLRRATLEKFNCGVAEDAFGKRCLVFNYRDSAGKVCCQKLRYAGKVFRVVGSMKEAGLYGDHLFNPGPSVFGRLVVCTGEHDAHAVHQASGGKWPAVSVPSGDSSAKRTFLKHLEWLETWDTVVLLFDNDESGQKASQECAEILSPGKVRVGRLPLKDASDMVTAGKSKELIDAIWQARAYRPDGLALDEDVWEAVCRKESGPRARWPFSTLDGMFHGIRAEMYIVAAGTGVGKTSFVRELCYSLLHQGDTVAFFGLEESIKRSALGLLALHLSRPIHLQEHDDLEMDELKQAFDEVIRDRVILYDHFGSMDLQALQNRIRYAVRSLGARWVILDHAHIAISGLGLDDERKALDMLFTHLRTLCSELECGMFVVSHLRRVSDTNHEGGADVALSHLRGSGGIAQLADGVIGLSRDITSTDSRHHTRLTVVKNRWSGICGPAGHLKYDEETGRLLEFDPAFEGEEVQEEVVPF